MALTVLEAWGAPALVAEAAVDAGGVHAPVGEVSAVKKQKDGVTFTWRTKLPMPMDEKWDAASVALESVSERLNRQILRVIGLRAGLYELDANGVSVGRFDAAELAGGLNVTEVPSFPTNTAAAEVLKQLQEPPSREAGPAAAAEARLVELCRPRSIAIAVRRVDEPGERRPD
jgi:hypothetical protein